MGIIHGIYTKFMDLYWWQMLLCGAYFLYFVTRTCQFWDATDDAGLWKGYKKLIFRYEKAFKIYHIVRIIFDMPPAVIGIFFPFLKKVLGHEIYKFKPDVLPKYEYLVTVSSTIIRDTQMVDTSQEGFNTLWNVEDERDKLIWSDIDNKDIVLGTVYTTSGSEAEKEMSEKYTTDSRFLHSYRIR
jgi:hypothetical protein